ncbi:hypothetical protein SOASR032_12860 [Pragia fontium]|uniref:Integrase DNA-binding domain-containing protein n=1 Tax=Pragia fontium TaxID=82985 RepID=A0ABQ5LGK4_9GAMM|nr:hypothetical protein SOASR032_12860 [Pragia fontium]
MLTDTQYPTAKSKEKRYRINDFNGLYLEVKPNGKKSCRFRFQINGNSSMLALARPFEVAKLNGLNLILIIHSGLFPQREENILFSYLYKPLLF